MPSTHGPKLNLNRAKRPLLAAVTLAAACANGRVEGPRRDGGSGPDRAGADQAGPGDRPGAADQNGPGDAARPPDGAPADGSPPPDAGAAADAAKPADAAPAAPHGSGGCGDPSFGDDFGNVPPCPSDARYWHSKYQKSRSSYVGGPHSPSPEIIPWDDKIAEVAQAYAEKYAAGAAPSGMMMWEAADRYDPYWVDSAYPGGYTAMAGSETPTACDCVSAGFITLDPPVFYNLSCDFFRVQMVYGLTSIDAMGVGHVGKPDGTHYWTALFRNKK